MQVCKKTTQQRMPPMGKLSHASDPSTDPQATRQVTPDTSYFRESDDQTQVPPEDRTACFKVCSTVPAD